MSIIGKFKAFIWWKGKVFHQEFHVTNTNSSPNLLSRDASLRMEVLQTCFAVTGKECPQLSQIKQGKHSIDSSLSKSSLTMYSINPKSVSKSPVTKEKIMEAYTDVFKGLGTFPGEPYRFRLKENYVPARHALKKSSCISTRRFSCRNTQSCQARCIRKGGTFYWMGKLFIKVEKDVSMDSGNSHAPHHKVQKKLLICLDPRDLNDVLKHEPYYSQSVDELIAKFHGYRVFSIVYMKKGYGWSHFTLIQNP